MSQTIDTSPARFPSRTAPIAGQHVTLVAFSPAHAEAMFVQVGGAKNGSLFEYMFFGPFESLEDYRMQTGKLHARQDVVLYSIILNDGAEVGKPVGLAAVQTIDLVHRTIEVGPILYSPLLQRTAAATEAMYLLAGYVFDDLGYRRLLWECNSFNMASEKAALRLGFTYEGLLRQHKFQRGKSRDTKVFSMLDIEWPDRRKALKVWLDADNFDDRGKQKQKLETLRKNIST